MVIAFLTIAMGGSMLGLQLHWKWHMRRGQRDFEREQDDRMAREMTVEQLAQAAFEGRFPYNAGKAWDR